MKSQSSMPLWHFWHYIFHELRPFPGRGKAVLRFTVVGALVIVLSMTFQVPFLAVSLLMTFFTARESTALTRMTGLVLVVGGTLGICAALAVLKVAFDYPLIRIVLTAVSIFAGMYFFRVSQLGVMGFILAVLVSYAQSLVDIIPLPETLVRMLLWAWIAAVYPVVITLLVNTLVFPVSPALLLKRASVDALDIIINALDRQGHNVKAEGPKLMGTARLIVSMKQYLTHSLTSGSQFKEHKNLHIHYVNGLERLLNAALSLPENNAGLCSWEERELCHGLQANAISLRLAISDEKIFSPPFNVTEYPAMQNGRHGALEEMAQVFIDLGNASQENLVAEWPYDNASLFATDAWVNPTYARFAIKCVLATLFCYVFYSAVDWPGIHTAMLTCLILALPSVEAITHKGGMRVMGCVLGGIVALLSAIFVIPHIDSIVGLLAVSLPVIAASAWIASGSERSSYIGVQLAFAFALSMFDQFGPTGSLTDVRDRMMGVLFGVAVATFIYTHLWPERESERLNNTMSELLQLLSVMILLEDKVNDPEKHWVPLTKMRIKGWGFISQCEEKLLRVKLEPSRRGRPDEKSLKIKLKLISIGNIFLSINRFFLTSKRDEQVILKLFMQRLAEYFNAVADFQRDPLMPQTKINETRRNVDELYESLCVNALITSGSDIHSMKKHVHDFDKISFAQNHGVTSG